MSSSENNQGIEHLDSNRLPTAVPEPNREPAIPNDTPAEEPQGYLTSNFKDLLRLQVSVYFYVVGGSVIGAIECAVIPTSILTGSIAVFLVCEVVRQARKVPYRAITSKTLLPDNMPMSLSLNAIASGALFFSKRQYLSEIGGLIAWNRYDLFFFTLAVNIIVTLIIKVYLHYRNKNVVKRHYD